MDPLPLGILSIAAILLLLGLGVHVALALGLVGFLGFVFVTGSVRTALGILTTTPYSTTASFSLTIIPLFILMGSFAIHGRMAQGVYDAAIKWLGRIPGSLGIATTLANAAFGAVCGSAVAAAALFTKLSIPEMKRAGYDVRFSAALIASAGLLSILIPPSLYAVIVGVLTELPISALLIAGVVPGVLLTAAYSVTIYTIAKTRPDIAPTTPISATRKEKALSLLSTWQVAVLAVIVLGGIYSGVFTATEAAAVGSLATLALVLITRTITRKGFVESLSDAVRTTAMLFLILIGATVYSRFLAVSGVSQGFLEAILALNWSPLALMSAFAFMYLVLGMFIDSISIFTLTLPILFPIIKTTGIDPMWFGMMVIFAVNLGLLTPPFGLNVYTVKAVITEDITLEDIFRYTVPFFISGVVVLALLLLFPVLSTWLPGAMLKR